MDQTLSPAVADKVTYIGTILPSFPQASQAIRKLLELPLNTKRVERLTERVGEERAAQRDAEARDYRQLTLTERLDQGPSEVTPPECCAVMLDGGRHQQVESNPTTDNHWYEYKAAICLELEGTAAETDPLPDVPQFLLDEDRVRTLTCEIGKKAADQPDDAAAVPQVNLDAIQNLDDLEDVLKTAALAAHGTGSKPGKSARDEPLSPPVASREVVATQQNCRVMGLLLVARAWSLGMFQSQRKAFVGDGSAWIWGVWEEHFQPAEFTPILDLIHAVTYVYATATAARSAREGWEVYRRWLKWVWEGRVAKVIEELTARQAELGPPSSDESETSPRSIISTGLTYLQNQQSRMNYPEYRLQGLPITSAHMESTVKEMNRRIKGSEKFWSETGAEAMLQLKADTLCDSQPLETFWKKRHETRSGFYKCVGRRTAQSTSA